MFGINKDKIKAAFAKFKAEIARLQTSKLYDANTVDGRAAYDSARIDALVQFILDLSEAIS